MTGGGKRRKNRTRKFKGGNYIPDTNTTNNLLNYDKWKNWFSNVGTTTNSKIGEFSKQAYDTGKEYGNKAREYVAEVVKPKSNSYISAGRKRKYKGGVDYESVYNVKTAQPTYWVNADGPTTIPKWYETAGGKSKKNKNKNKNNKKTKKYRKKY
jgi:hypothetical protein